MSAVTISVYSQDVNFNKYEWESRWLAAVRCGDVGWQTGTLAPVLRTSLGTAEDRCHVPVVWRRDSTLAELSGMSAPTYRKRRDELTDAGFLFEIASGYGSRRTIKVLKMPSWTESKALHIARDALAAFCERTRNDRLEWVEDALCYAIQCEEAAASATYQGERVTTPEPEEEEANTDQMKGAFSANEKTFHLPPYIQEKYPDITGSSSLLSPLQAKSDVPSATPERLKTDTKTHSVIDLDRLKRLRAVLISLFAEVGRMLDEGAATHLAKVYGRQGATAEALLETLEIKLLRLIADGYSTGQISAFLAKDAPAWTPPPPKIDSEALSSHPKPPQEPEPFPDFWQRLAELDTQFAGDLDRIRTTLVDEFGHNHPCLK